MCKIFKISLKPLDWFFFGGEKTFNNGIKDSYYANSEMYPQQTALLGMLRYQFLKENGLLTRNDFIPDAKAVEALVGNSSFCAIDSEQTFGVINELSPVFLENEGGMVVRMPMTQGYDLTFDPNVKVSLNGKKKNVLINDNGTFDPKKYDNYLKWKNSDNPLDFSDIFVSRTKIGITKNSQFDESNDDGFYKMEMLKLKVPYRYVFYASLNASLPSGFVYLGGERSCFKMEVEQVQDFDNVKDAYLSSHPSKSQDKQIGRIELLSPTYIADVDKLNEYCIFHWSYMQPFRNIQQAKSGNGKLNSGLVSYHRKQICYNMLTAGSVLFFAEENRKKVEGLIDNPHFKKIGYNYYI